MNANERHKLVIEASKWWTKEQGGFTLHCVSTERDGVFATVTREGESEPERIRLPDDLVELYLEAN